MINGNIEQFLDTGWYTEAELYYNGFIYWFEAKTDFETNISRFFIEKWRVFEEEDYSYSSYIDKDGKLIDYQKVFEISDKDMDFIKEQFLKAPIFDGKTFWDVEKEIAWFEYSGHDILFVNRE